MSKFAKKNPGHLVVDLDNPKGPKMAVVGQGNSKQEKDILKKVGADKVKGKPAKPAKAEKPAKAAKGKVAKKETSGEPDNRKIKLLTKENPKREGSASFKRFALYSKCKTVAEFLKAGGTAGDLRYDEQKGYISVA